MSKTYSVYILTNQNNRALYIGVTNDLQRRMHEHRNKMIDGFSKTYNLTKLVYHTQTDNIEVAILHEKKLKGWTRQKKIDLITAHNFDWRDLSETLHF